MDRIKQMYLEKVINTHEYYKNITETEELILTVNKEQTGENGSKITFEDFWELCIKKASKVDLQTNQVGSYKKQYVFSTDITNNEYKHIQNFPDDTSDDNNQLLLANKMSQLQRRRNALTKEEKLLSYLWKQINTKLTGLEVLVSNLFWG